MAKKNNDKFLNNNESLPILIDFNYSLEQIEEIRKCKNDIFYFAENYFFIVNLDEGRQKIKLYEAQKRAIKKIVDNRYTIICASRQCGKTSLMTIVCLWYSIFNKDFTIAVLANKEEMAKEIVDRIKLAYQELPNWLKAGVWGFTKERVDLTNGSKIISATTSSDAVRGKSINLLFLDEFAYVPKEIAESFFKSVMPTISSSKKAKIVIVSTPNGATGKYYEIFSEAEKNEARPIKNKNGWACEKIYWREIPGRTEEWKQEQLALTGYDMTLWNQEYEIQFLEDGVSTINLELINKLKEMCYAPEMSFDNGDYIIWKEPQEDHIYSIGVDCAEGVGQDFSIAQVIDITDPTNMEQCAIFATNRMGPYVFAEKLNQIIRSWGRPFLCIESNKEGTAVIEALYNVHKYDNIVSHTMKNDKEGRYQKMGIFCHQNAKSMGILNMKYYLEHLEAVKLYDINTVKEFETFVRKENKVWGAKKGFKDDRIMALIWAIALLEITLNKEYLEVLEYDDTGKPARIRDPYIELSNQMMREGNTLKTSNYARFGGQPLPTVFQFGSPGGTYREKDLESYSNAGWRVL